MKATADDHGSRALSPQRMQYRPEIDGLRAFAVCAVIINHFNQALLPGGYLGVDIFFVISGYVITGSLAARESRSIQDFLINFYRRRIRRLVPALLLFVIVLSVIISLIDPDPKLELKTAALSLVGFSNLYLYEQATDYFAQSTQLNPFMHSWSLGVEEQFYLLFPFLMWCTGFARQSRNGARNLFVAMGAIAIASLVAFVYLYAVDQPAAYFLMPPRFWEMAAGALIFIGYQKRAQIEHLLEQIPPLLVILMMAGIMCLPNPAAVPATIAIVVLTAILIACLKRGTAAFAFFRLEQVVFLGLISYSLYLWHWGVLCVSRWTIGIHWWSVPFQLMLMLGLAAASYRWIEVPFRKSKEIAQVQTFMLGGAMAVMSMALLMLANMKTEAFFYLGKQNHRADRLDKQRSELAIELGDLDIVLIGDSHAGHFSKSFIQASKSTGFRFRKYSDGATAFPELYISSATGGLTIQKNRSSVLKMSRQANHLIQSLDPRKSGVIVLSSFYQYYFHRPMGSKKYVELQHYSAAGRRISKAEALDGWIESVYKLIRGRPSNTFVVVLSTPEMPGIYPEKMCGVEVFRPWPDENCAKELPLSAFQGAYHRVNMKLARLGDLRNVIVVDPIPLLCGKEPAVCSSVLDGKRIYSDEDHLNGKGPGIVVDAILRRLEDGRI